MMMEQLLAGRQTENRKKLLGLVMLLVLLLLTLAGCGSADNTGGTDAAAKFDEEQVIATAKDVVATINTQDYEAVCALIAPELQANVSAADLEASWGEQLKTNGAFKEFGNIAVTYSNDKSYGDCAVAALVCQYENGQSTFTLSFNTALQLNGLYMK